MFLFAYELDKISHLLHLEVNYPQSILQLNTRMCSGKHKVYKIAEYFKSILAFHSLNDDDVFFFFLNQTVAFWTKLNI